MQEHSSRVNKRRSHTKSRNGCYTCKHRKIKCDEAKPVCGHCRRFSIPCSFSSSITGSLDAVVQNPSTRRRGRPRKNWAAEKVGPSGQIYVHGATQTEGEPNAFSAYTPRSPLLNADDLELFHHYLRKTSSTVGGSVMWQDKVPTLAFEHHCVLHLLLACAAFHIARLRSSASDRYLQLADSHLTAGIRQVTALLNHLDKDNCSALYVATCLIFTCSFAKMPSPGHLMLVSADEQAPWYTLIRGVRYVIETMGFEAIFSGTLGPFPPTDEKESLQDGRELDMILWEEPLTKLSQLVSINTGQKKKVYESVLEVLKYCFHETYGSAAEPKDHPTGKFHIIMAWSYRLEDDYVVYLKHGEPIALLLLAYFAVLLHTLDHVWFIEGWAAHILKSTRAALGPELRKWLIWPTEQLSRAAKND